VKAFLGARLEQSVTSLHLIVVRNILPCLGKVLLERLSANETDLPTFSTAGRKRQ
jgi:hypothetical protein